MKKRWLAMLFCAAMIMNLAVPPAQAEDFVFFTAMGESILPLTDETMPFLSGNQIFIPTSIFTGTVRRALNVSSTYNKQEKLVILYRGSHSLWFYQGRDHARDNEDNVYYPGAIVKGNEVFVSATLVARFFDLTYTIAEVPHGYMVWFRNRDYPLSDERFADAASYSMDNRYAAYIKAKEEAAANAPTQAEIPEMDGKAICLALTAAENTARMLDTLEAENDQAAVFFTPSQMAEMGGLLRRMAVRGHSAGILLDGAAETDILQAAEHANRLLEEATCGRTRLIRVENAAQEQLDALRNAGYCPAIFDMEPSALYSPAQAEVLVQRISRYSGNVKMWLGKETSVSGLEALLRAVEAADGHCRALTEIF